MATASSPAAGSNGGMAQKLADLGPSPYAKRRRHLMLRTSWDVVQCLAICAVSLHLFARHAGEGAEVSSAASSSYLSYVKTLLRVAAADPLQAGCCCFCNFFMVSMCGNSPVAYVAAFGVAIVDDATFQVRLLWLWRPLSSVLDVCHASRTLAPRGLPLVCCPVGGRCSFCAWADESNQRALLPCGLLS